MSYSDAAFIFALFAGAALLTLAANTTIVIHRDQRKSKK